MLSDFIPNQGSGLEFPLRCIVSSVSFSHYCSSRMKNSSQGNFSWKGNLLISLATPFCKRGIFWVTNELFLIIVIDIY